MKICEAFALILDIAERRGVRDIGKLPGCWEFRAGDWLVTVNGGREERRTTQGDAVPPFHALAVRDRAAFAVALITPEGGTCAAGVEDDLIAALREELEVARG